jgi:hypothetical protein
MSWEEYQVTDEGGFASIKFGKFDYSGDNDESILVIGTDIEANEITRVKGTPTATGNGVAISFRGGLEAEGIKTCIKRLANKMQSEEDIQQLSYRVFELIEPAIKQAIAQAIQEHFES